MCLYLSAIPRRNVDCSQIPSGAITGICDPHPSPSSAPNMWSPIDQTRNYGASRSSFTVSFNLCIIISSMYVKKRIGLTYQIHVTLNYRTCTASDHHFVDGNARSMLVKIWVSKSDMNRSSYT